MSKHITVIDVSVGVPGKYAVRVGPEVSPPLRLANCYNEANGTLVKIAGTNYANYQKYTSYNDFNKAVAVARNLKTTYSGYTVRVDCTIG